MNSRKPGIYWSVFEDSKEFPTTPDELMAEIDSAIADLEYSRASNILKSSPYMGAKSKDSDVISSSRYDIRTADEAYKMGRAALAAGKLDEALHSLNISLSKCPPEKTSAVAKLHSLISLTSQQLQRSAK